jgi:hypothetical protein
MFVEHLFLDKINCRYTACALGNKRKWFYLGF